MWYRCDRHRSISDYAIALCWVDLVNSACKKTEKNGDKRQIEGKGEKIRTERQSKVMLNELEIEIRNRARTYRCYNIRSEELVKEYKETDCENYNRLESHMN